MDEIFCAFRVVPQRGETHKAAFARELKRCGASLPLCLPVLAPYASITLTAIPSRDMQAADGVFYIRFVDAAK